MVDVPHGIILPGRFIIRMKVMERNKVIDHFSLVFRIYNFTGACGTSKVWIKKKNVRLSAMKSILLRSFLCYFRVKMSDLNDRSSISTSSGDRIGFKVLLIMKYATDEDIWTNYCLFYQLTISFFSIKGKAGTNLLPL